MRRSSLVLVAVGIMAGCAPPVTPVRVDLNRVLAAESTAVPPSPEMPSPPAPAGPRRVLVPGLKADQLEDPSTTNVASVARTIEDQQREARKQLEKRLRAVYAEQVRLFELEAKRELERIRPAAFDVANRQIRERFETYADQRAPLAASLYDIVGFPDPNPRSDPPKSPLGKVDQGFFDQAIALRKQLAEVEAAYQREKEAILRDAEDRLSEEEAAALTRVRELADDLEARAAREAAEQVQISVEDLGLQLTDPQPITLKATKSQRVEIPAESALAPAPQVPSSRIPNAPEDRRRRAKRELDIWLQVNRYRLDPKARDATEEFQTWRRSHGAGL